MTIQNKAQLITYPDSLGNNLIGLHYVLQKYLKDLVGGVHLLPFYPSSADRGFAPLTYDEVDPNFGSWKDVEEIGQDYDLIVDFMVNHISRQSKYFQDYIEKGELSEYADMFLSFNKIDPAGKISEDDLAKVHTRKPRLPYSVIERSDGSKEKIWSTFDYEQIDLDWQSPKTREIMRRYLIQLARIPSRIIRMGAFAYTTLKIGTSCFFQEPEVWELLEWLKGFVEPFGAEVLPEVHGHYSYQLKLSERGFWCYDFALPMLVLHTLYHHTNRPILKWLKKCPRKQLTTLDTHDGIGVVDVKDLLSDDEIDRTLNGLYEKGSKIKRLYSKAEFQKLDIYQVNCTYYSALEENDNSYIAARAIQFFAPGIPQVYYVGLLAGENDIELVEKTQQGRNINRHNYTLEEIESAIKKPVVQRLFKLIKFRNNYPAFNGNFNIHDSADDEIILSWTNKNYIANMHTNLNTYQTNIKYFDSKSEQMEEFSS